MYIMLGVVSINFKIYSDVFVFSDGGVVWNRVRFDL